MSLVIYNRLSDFYAILGPSQILTPFVSLILPQMAEDTLATGILTSFYSFHHAN